LLVVAASARPAYEVAVTAPSRSRFLHARMLTRCALLLGFTAAPACAEPEEAQRVELPVQADGRGLTRVTTDLGYTVELSEARGVVAELRFSIAGEQHSASRSLLSRLVVSTAHAHPGHFQGGGVTGELPGRFVAPWLSADDDGAAAEASRTLGTATLLEGDYHSVDFELGLATTEDDIMSDDPLLGHSFVLRGEVEKDGERYELLAQVASPEGRVLTGVPFDARVRAGEALGLQLRLLTLDPLEGDTLFDGIDFATLDADADGLIAIEPEAADAAVQQAYNVLRRTLQTHDHFEMTAEENL